MQIIETLNWFSDEIERHGVKEGRSAKARYCVDVALVAGGGVQ